MLFGVQEGFLAIVFNTTGNALYADILVLVVLFQECLRYCV